jgi:hypothetical protein
VYRFSDSVSLFHSPPILWSLMICKCLSGIVSDETYTTGRRATVTCFKNTSLLSTFHSFYRCNCTLFMINNTVITTHNTRFLLKPPFTAFFVRTGTQLDEVGSELYTNVLLLYLICTHRVLLLYLACTQTVILLYALLYN